MKLEVIDEFGKKFEFALINDLIHFMAHCANLMAKEHVKVIVDLPKSALESDRVEMKFSGFEFDFGDAWTIYRNAASTNLQHLKLFYSKKNLKDTLKFMDPSEERNNIERAFKHLIWMLELACSFRHVDEKDLKHIDCKYFILFPANSRR
jgi:hypothetical protein